MSAQPNIIPPDVVDNATIGGGFVEMRIASGEAPLHSSPALPTGAVRKPLDNAPERRAHYRDLWTKAKRAAERLWESAKGNRGEVFGAIVELNNLFERLWEHKSQRDDNWVGILEQARTVAEALSAADIENATADQCWNLLLIVETYLSPSTKTVEDLQAVVELVSGMGLNPYEGLGALGNP